jgi:D-3-phosphoglycerate dehydrogenase / 2-oxoglutarate reductase
MPRPVLLLNCGRYYQPGYFEHHWPKLLERCEIRFTDLSEGPELAEQMADVDVMIARRDYVGRSSLEAARKLRGVVTGGVGVEKVDVDLATELGIVVANSPGNTITVAESTILLMLTLGKGMLGWIEAGKTGTEPTSSMHGMELYRKTLGLIGFGRIGRWVARLATAFGMKVLAYDPYVFEAEQAELVSLEEVLQRSDFVSLHPVLTPETFHMINAERLAQMKPTAILINTSRGGVIDEPALIAALQRGQIAGAGLDVFEKEPPALDNPLLHMPNVIGTPHGLSHAEESFDRCASYTQDNVLALLDGKLPPYLVNKTVSWRSLGVAAR